MPMGHHHFPATSSSTFSRPNPAAPKSPLRALGAGQVPSSIVCKRSVRETSFWSPLHVSLAVCPWGRSCHSRSFGLLRGKQDMRRPGGCLVQGRPVPPCSTEEALASSQVVT